MAGRTRWPIRLSALSALYDHEEFVAEGLAQSHTIVNIRQRSLEDTSRDFAVVILLLDGLVPKNAARDQQRLGAEISGRRGSHFYQNLAGLMGEDG